MVNGSFENNSQPDLSSWEWVCAADSFNDSPMDCGSWCLQVDGGNLQGCFPGYAYQKIPSIADGQSFLLSGWAYAETSPEVGIYFGKINNGFLTLQAGSLTSSNVWTQLSIQSAFSLSAGDTAVVLLWGGLVTGAALSHGYFDCIILEPLTGIFDAEEKSHGIFPNPAADYLNITSPFSEGTIITISGIDGKDVKTITSPEVNTKMQINVSDLGAGIYFLKVIGKHSTTVERFIKL